MSSFLQDLKGSFEILHTRGGAYPAENCFYIY